MNQVGKYRWRRVVLLVVSLAASMAQAGAPPEYIELTQAFTRNEDFVNWDMITQRLQQDFDYICGDTAYSGEVDH